MTWNESCAICDAAWDYHELRECDYCGEAACPDCQRRPIGKVRVCCNCYGVVKAEWDAAEEAACIAEHEGRPIDTRGPIERLNDARANATVGTCPTCGEIRSLWRSPGREADCSECASRRGRVIYDSDRDGSLLARKVRP